ncbi:MAG: low molecular weight protein-tyrosine-phosphatase [Gammaproteobacteria bacterium]
MTTQVHILFVCMGNICRSPAAEGVFRHYIGEQGDQQRIRVDSAGTLSYHAGSPADERMQQAASRRGYALDSIARQVKPDDIQAFDLIIPMDEQNLTELELLAGGPREHIRLLGSWLPGVGEPSVPDPYYGGEAGFEQVLDMIEAACPALHAHCRTLLDGK